MGGGVMRGKQCQRHKQGCTGAEVQRAQQAHRHALTGMLPFTECLV